MDNRGLGVLVVLSLHSFLSKEQKLFKYTDISYLISVVRLIKHKYHSQSQ